MLKKTSWNPYSSSGSTRAIKRPLKGKKGCSALKQLQSLSPLLGAPKEVLRKCQFLIKTRVHDDHFLREYIQLGELREAWRGFQAYSGPRSLEHPPRRLKKKKGLLITEVSIRPEERVLNVSPCALSPPWPIPGPDNNTAVSRHHGLALTINAMNKSHKRVGNALYWVRQSPVLPFKDSFYVGIRLLLMKFKLIRGNQKPPIRLQIDFFGHLSCPSIELLVSQGASCWGGLGGRVDQLPTSMALYPTLPWRKWEVGRDS